MKSKKIKVLVLITAILVILCSVTATVLATAPSKNKNYKSSLEETYAYLTGNYKKDNPDNGLAKIVAYVNDIPIYYSHVVYIRGICEIQYNEYVLSGEDAGTAFDLAKKLSQATDQELIQDIAKQRAMIIEAENRGISISDEAVKQKQEEEKKIREQGIDAKHGVTIEINKQYQELYKKLQVSEKEYYETYDFLSKKNALLTEKVAKDYIEEYTQKRKETGEEFDPNVMQKYYDSLLEKVDFRLA